MQGTAFRVLFGGLRRAGLSLAVPETARDEAVNRFREECMRLQASVRKLTREASRVLGSQPPHGFQMLDSIDSLVKVYISSMQETFQEHGVRVLAYPTVAHQELVARALARKRPFAENGSGYRDALIWHSLLELLRAGESPFAFITANTRDFGEAPNLHPDLAADLLAEGLDPANLRLFRTLEDLNHALIIPTLDRLADIKKRFEEPGPDRPALESWLAANLQDLLDDFTDVLGPFHPDHGSTHLSSLGPPSLARIDAVRQLSDSQILLAVVAKTEAHLYLSADQDDLEYEDVRDFFGPKR